MDTLRRWGMVAAAMVFAGRMAAVSAQGMTPEEAAEKLREHCLANERSQVQGILERAQGDPAFRSEVVQRLLWRFSSGERSIGGIDEDQDLCALRDLDAKEALPQLLQCWERTVRETRDIEKTGAGIMLLETIAHLLPEKERIEFLIRTEEDLPIARFRTTILLCATGNEKAIQHVLSTYEQAKRMYGRTTRITVAKQTRARPEPYDQDADGMTDYVERGLLLDPTNPDTNGDGIFDGNDRNPLCAGREKLSETQETAAFLFYLHASRGRDCTAPFNFRCWIVPRADDSDNRRNPSVLGDVELTGFDGIVLHMDDAQQKRYLDLHGYGMPIVRISEVRETGETQAAIECILGPRKPGDECREFQYVAPLAAQWAIVRVKRFGAVWLPIQWGITAIS